MGRLTKEATEIWLHLSNLHRDSEVMLSLARYPLELFHKANKVKQEARTGLESTEARLSL
jgi:hypothetical protein